MIVRKRLFIAAMAATALIFTPLATASADEEFWAAVMRDLPEANVSLDQALRTSEREGKPISAEYDVEGSDFQISVYVEKDRHFREVIVDPNQGRSMRPNRSRLPRRWTKLGRRAPHLRKATLSLTCRSRNRGGLK